MDQALSATYAPFTFALGLMLALLLLEVLAMILGFSLHGSEAEVGIAPHLAELQGQFDLDPDTSPDLPQLLEASAALHQTAPDLPDSGPLALIGLREVPMMIWLASMLFSFGLGGFLIQGLTGGALPRLGAIALALAAALVFTRKFARAFARLVPRLETSATSAQFMGGLRGVVSQGTARAGSAAEVRLRDRHGNIHFIRCEPFTATDVIAEGTEVLTLREKLGPGRWSLRILPLS